jgi:hypothetical protein
MKIHIVVLIVGGFIAQVHAQIPNSDIVAGTSNLYVGTSSKVDGVSQSIQQSGDSSKNCFTSKVLNATSDSAEVKVGVMDSTTVENIVQLDTIVKLSGKSIVGNIVKDNLSKFYYFLPNETKLIEIERAEINKIVYKSGKVVVLNLKEANAQDVPGWRDVKVVYKPTEVEGMDTVADVESYCASETGVYQTAKWLERKATIDLQKKTVLLHGDCLLIVDKIVRRSYGDPTTIQLFGRIYKKR